MQSSWLLKQVSLVNMHFKGFNHTVRGPYLEQHQNKHSSEKEKSWDHVKNIHVNSATAKYSSDFNNKTICRGHFLINSETMTFKISWGTLTLSMV
jgi:hypothetical protein